jgi:hypothetical protein
MITLATFTNEMDAQLLESQLRSNDVECRVKRADEGRTGIGTAESYAVMVFEDDLDLAKEILEARAFDDDMPGFDTTVDTDIDLDALPDV